MYAMVRHDRHASFSGYPWQRESYLATDAIGLRPEIVILLGDLQCTLILGTRYKTTDSRPRSPRRYGEARQEQPGQRTPIDTLRANNARILTYKLSPPCG